MLDSPQLPPTIIHPPAVPCLLALLEWGGPSVPLGSRPCPGVLTPPPLVPAPCLSAEPSSCVPTGNPTTGLSGDGRQRPEAVGWCGLFCRTQRSPGEECEALCPRQKLSLRVLQALPSASGSVIWPLAPCPRWLCLGGLPGNGVRWRNPESPCDRR